MRLQQFIGPFTNNQVLFNINNVSYMQLGIEHPHSIPLSELESLEDNQVIVGIYTSEEDSNAITQKDFIIFEKDILEFRLNGRKTIKVVIRQNINNPYLIINAAYEDAT